MKKYKKKYNKGTQKVDVPPTMTGADVGAQALSGAAAGAAMGSVAGPWGTAIGGVVGGAAGALKGFSDKDKAQLANTKALAINSQADRNMNTGIDPRLQNYQFKKGSSYTKSKQIEIEGKKYPEIHTDKNYNIKTLGTTPHSEGGTKTVATEGDVVFDTQNSEKDYKQVTRDISLYKMKGDKNAYKRLEQRRNEMPSDSNTKKYDGDSFVKPFNVYDYTGTNPGTQYDFQANPLIGTGSLNIPDYGGQRSLASDNLGTDMFGDPIIDKGNNYDQLGYSTDKINSLNGTGTLGIPEGSGRSLPSDKSAVTSRFNANSLNNVGRYANIGYNAIQALNKPQQTLDRQLELNRYKYSDMSDPLRQAARQNRTTQLYNAGRAGSSIGQQQAYGQQAQNNYSDQLGQINAGENERKQGIQNANVDLSNTENQINYERAYYNNDVAAKRRAAQQSFGAAAASEAASLSEIQQQEKLQRLAQDNLKERDNQYLDTFRDRNFYFGNPDEVGFQPQFEKTGSNTSAKSKYVYKSGTKTKRK